MALLGAILGGLLFWGAVAREARPGEAVPVLVVDGVSVMVSNDRGAVVIETKRPIPGTFSHRDGRFQAGYEVPSGGMTGDRVAPETCLAPGSSGQPLRFGVLKAAPGEGPGGAILVWYECLGPPGQ